MNMKPMYCIALVVLALSTVAARGEEMRGSLKVVGNEVEIHVHYQDGAPAAGVTIRLLDARNLVTAVSRTSDQGRWVTAVQLPGAYRAIIETDGDGEENLSLPFTVAESVPTRNVPWSTLFLGSACLLGAAFLFFAGIRKPAGIGLFLAAAISLLAWSAWVGWFKPIGRTAYGPDIPGEAPVLRSQNVKPLSDPLKKLLEDDGENRIKTQPHALLGTAAPNFELADHRQTIWKLHDRLKNGPVVLVFYYGYQCNHCVSQLFALRDDISKFHELGAEIVAVRCQCARLTRERFKQYGEFAFPVLSDPANKIARAYGVFQSAAGKAPENLQHGTFVIGRDGLVHSALSGDEPFTGNRTLVHELAKLEGRLPENPQVASCTVRPRVAIR